MIKAVSNNYLTAILFSLIILSVNMLPYGFENLALTGLLFVCSVILDIICQRFRILGMKSHLPLVITSLLSVLMLKYLDIELILVGGLWLVALYLSFKNREGEANPVHSLIYIGVLLGIAQTIEQWAVFLFIPFFIMFFQSAVGHIRFYVISIMYFLLVLFIYTSVIYVMEIIDQAWQLIPSPSFDYSVFNTPLVKLYLPFVTLILVIHLLFMGSYRFRYPNRSIIINYMLLIQLVIGVLLTIVTANTAFFAIILLPMGVLVSVGFAFNQHRLFIDAAFAAFILLTVGISLIEWQGYIQF